MARRRVPVDPRIRLIAREFCTHLKPGQKAVDTNSGWPCRPCLSRAKNARVAVERIPRMFDPDDVQGIPAPSLSVVNSPAVGLAPNAGADTSRAAALAVWPKTGTQRAEVLNVFVKGRPYGQVWTPRGDEPEGIRYEFTDEELQAATGLPANTVRPRRVELVDGGWLMDSGDRRPTRAGHDAIVWCLTERAVDTLDPS